MVVLVTVDFHGLNLDDAENKLHLLIGKARSKRSTTMYRLITGNGRIKRLLPEWLRPYQLVAQEELANRGAMIVVVD